MNRGPEIFARFAYPPNALGYCGPADSEWLVDLVEDGAGPPDEYRRAIAGFAGAWPYLELIAHAAGREPLEAAVVEAYWLGNELLHRIDTLDWGNSLDDRFRRRAGHDWDRIVAGLHRGGLPNHSFHVFCVYPWVGLLRSGVVEQAVEVLDRCRIRWGRVVGLIGDAVLVESRPLRWDGKLLHLGDPALESVRRSVDPGISVTPGQAVALHWDYLCQPISREQLAGLQRQQQRHLAIANNGRLAGRIES